MVRATTVTLPTLAFPTSPTHCLLGASAPNQSLFRTLSPLGQLVRRPRGEHTVLRHISAHLGVSFGATCPRHPHFPPNWRVLQVLRLRRAQLRRVIHNIVELDSLIAHHLIPPPTEGRKVGRRVATRTRVEPLPPPSRQRPMSRQGHTAVASSCPRVATDAEAADERSCPALANARSRHLLAPSCGETRAEGGAPRSPRFAADHPCGAHGAGALYPCGRGAVVTIEAIAILRRRRGPIWPETRLATPHCLRGHRLCQSCERCGCIGADSTLAPLAHAAGAPSPSCQSPTRSCAPSEAYGVTGYLGHTAGTDSTKVPDVAPCGGGYRPFGTGGLSRASL